MKKTLFILAMFCLLVLWLTSATSPGKTATTDRDSYGLYVQRAMLAYYYTRDTQCGNDTPLYTCAGLMASRFDGGHDWYEPYVANNNENISFSYWTPRTQRASVFDLPKYDSQGIVLWPNVMLASDGTAMLPNYTCAYNHDAGTTKWLGNGCGQSKQKCQKLGIYTMTQYLARYGDDPVMTQCGNALNGVAVDAVLAFDTTLEEEAYFIEKEGNFAYDKIVMKAWPADAPAKVPLMAFYCDRTKTDQHPDYSDDTCPEATKQQADYYNKYQVFAPVIRIVGDWPHATFSYALTDQSANIPKLVNVFAGLKYEMSAEAGSSHR